MMILVARRFNLCCTQLKQMCLTLSYVKSHNSCDVVRVHDLNGDLESESLKEIEE